MRKRRKPRDPYPYDSVFRTMVTDCRRLLILAINCFLDEHHPLDSKVQLFPDTFILRQQDGKMARRITDANFRIEEQHFLFECQSTEDKSMPSRFFEYGAQIALLNGEIRDNNLDVFFPNCILLYLRSSEHTPDKMQVRIHAEAKQTTVNDPF